MMQKPWFKLFVWIAASAFFFLLSSILIAWLSPEPSNDQIMKFMAGMMSAMESSMMGLSMSLEGDADLKNLIVTAASITIPIVFLSVLYAVFIRIRRG